ncbi:hypothetical protein Sjap_008800 [Stephania japonica]|uniref:Uncharacterized protein n=1 Tax=Stephania japonica TaxID=461633 RepID=A0AAP0PET9_9MAGN
MWNDENIVEPEIDDEASQEEEEEQQEDDQSLANRGRRRKTTRTQTLGESIRRSPPLLPTRPHQERQRLLVRAADVLFHHLQPALLLMGTLL